jgi:hypothetical protein
MATPSLFPQFMKAQAGGGGGPITGFTLIEGGAVVDPLTAEIAVTTLTAEVDTVFLEAKLLQEPLPIT